MRASRDASCAVRLLPTVLDRVQAFSRESIDQILQRSETKAVEPRPAGTSGGEGEGEGEVRRNTFAQAAFISQDGEALDCASEQLKGDREVALELL